MAVPTKIKLDIKQALDKRFLLLPGLGNTVIPGGQAGRLLVLVEIMAHPLFVRDGACNIRCEVHINAASAILGTSVTLKGLYGNDVVVPIAPGTQSGTEIVVKEQGLKREGLSSYTSSLTIKGDLICRVIVDKLGDLTPEQQELLQKLQASFAAPGAPQP